MNTTFCTGYSKSIDEITKARNEIKACIANKRQALKDGQGEAAEYWQAKAESALASYKRLTGQEQPKPLSGKDALQTRSKIAELRYLLGGKKRDIAKTTNLRLLTAMQKDVTFCEDEIARLTALLPTGFGFRDLVDRTMNQGRK